MAKTAPKSHTVQTKGDWRLPPYIVHQTIQNFDVQASLPWHIKQYGIDTQLWPVSTGKKAKIGIVDTGVSSYQAQRGELKGRIAEAKDFTGSRLGVEDMNGHGTHVAGIVAANTFGVAKECQLVIAKSLGDDGSGSDQSVVAGMKLCANNGCQVINMSLGSDQDSPSILGLCAELHQQGILIVAAAGNDAGQVNSPGRSQHVICDTAVDQENRIAPFSCHGPEVDVCAPGVKILSLGTMSSLVYMSGTSMSSPWVAGMLGAYISWQIDKGLAPLKSVSDAITWLTKSSTDLGDPGADQLYGVGLLDAKKMFGTPANPVTQPTVGISPLSVTVIMNDGKAYVFVPALAGQNPVPQPIV